MSNHRKKQPPFCPLEQHYSKTASFLSIIPQNKLNFSFEYYNQILNKTGYIDSFKGKWSSLIGRKESSLFKNLVKSALRESIVSSYRMEGVMITQEEIKEFPASNSIYKMLTQQQQEIISFVEVSNEYLSNYSKVELSQKYLKQLYKDLFKNENLDTPLYSEYKKKPNRVVAYSPNGTHKDILNTTEPYLVEKEIHEILTWTMRQMNSNLMHPLIIIGLFTYELILIQPFQYANCRFSYILTRLLLLKSGYTFINYLSFENIIERNKLDFFDALKGGQINRYSYEERINKWLLFFLTSIQTAIIKLENSIENPVDEISYINERQKKLKNNIRKYQPVKLADVARRMQDVSINTMKKDLQQLKAMGIISSSGKNRGTVYSVVE